MPAPTRDARIPTLRVGPLYAARAAHVSATLEDHEVPTFGAGVRFRHDEVRQAWVVLAPERLFLPDEQAVEILKLIDGERSFGGIVDHLAERFNAPHAVIAADVSAMLRELADKGVLRIKGAQA